MDIFGFNSKKVYSYFEFIYLILSMMLIPCSWAQENIPSFNITCDSTVLLVKITFSKPFSGIAYAKGHKFDPLCSLTKSSVLDGSLSLPLTACGTYVQETSHPWVTNTVVIQQHPLARTENDFEKSIICSLPQPFGNFSSSSAFLDQIQESHYLAPTKPLPDIEIVPDVFHDDVGPDDYTYTRLTIFQLLNGTIYNDIGVKNCIASEQNLDVNASGHQIPNHQGCFTVNSENSSSLTIHYIEGGIIADVKIKTFETESLDHYILKCEVFLCKTKCSCSEIDQQIQHPTSDISHKLTKRSTETSSEMFSLKQYEARTRYLKSTVKALMDNIMEQRKRNDEKAKVKKRVMRMDDPFLFETNSLGSHAIASNENISPELVTTEFYNTEPHLEDASSDSESQLINVSDDFDYGYHLIDDYDYEPDDSEYSDEEAVSTVTQIPNFDPDTVVLTLPKELKENYTKIVPDEKLKVKGLRVLSDDVVSSVDAATENMKIATTTISDLSPNGEVAQEHHESCVPRYRFVTITIVMGFVIGSLLLVTCGMILYIRKEKKRNKLNDFLLYSIGY